VIVCGLHRVGLRIVQQLSLSGVPAVVVDDDPDLRLARNLITWGVPHIAGTAHTAETLAEAGLAGAAAVVCAEEDDLRTLETALLTRKLRADVHVVVQLTNPAVGRALSQIEISVLDTAGLAAPSIVEACLGTGQDIWLSGERFAAVRTTAPRAASLRELYGDLAPVAVTPASGGDAEICPGRDHEVAPGDEVTLIGTPAELGGAGLSGLADRPAGPVPALAARQVRYARQLALSLLRAVDRRLGWALGALFAVVLVSTALLRLAYQTGTGHHMSVLDAAYFTVETVTTVGYGDYSFRGQPAWLIAGATGLMLAGALFVAVFFAMVTNAIVGLRISELLGRQRITGLSGHVLVIGLGSVGMQVVRLLTDAGTAIVVVENDERNRHLAQARALGVPVVIADGTQPETLESVSLSSASAVAVLTSDDLANLEAGLAVRDQLGERRDAAPVVLRMFDPQLARSVRESFGFSFVGSTAALAAPWFVGAALGLDVLSTFYAGDQPLLVARLTVTPDGGLHGLAMGDLAARTRVLAIRRAADPDRLEHPPRRGTRFEPADETYLIGPYEELLAVLRRDRPSPQAADSPAGERLSGRLWGLGGVPQEQLADGRRVDAGDVLLGAVRYW
jgi:Trk K+ transport system NAD-binding subunit